MPRALVACSYCDAGTCRCVAVSSSASGERTGAVLCPSVAKMVAADGYKLECCVGVMQGAGQEIFPFSTST